MHHTEQNNHFLEVEHPQSTDHRRQTEILLEPSYEQSGLTSLGMILGAMCTAPALLSSITTDRQLGCKLVH